MRTSAGCLFMGPRKFIKPRLSTDEQLSLLKKQHLVINDENLARNVLKAVGYYRFSGYSLPFKSPHQANNHRIFKPGTSFDLIWQLYQFDRELRLLTYDAIEKIEIAFRSAISEITSDEFGIFWYMTPEFYRNNKPYKKLIRDVDKILTDWREVFIQHYFDNYFEPPYPPIWMIIELLSFGSCSKMFSNIKSLTVRRKICEIFGQHPTIIESWMKTIAGVRNLCAHHARLWNRWLLDAPIILKDEPLHDYLQEKNRRFIVCAYILMRLLHPISSETFWKQKLYDLFSKYEQYPGLGMGFISNWKDDLFWEL